MRATSMEQPPARPTSPKVLYYLRFGQNELKFMNENSEGRRSIRSGTWGVAVLLLAFSVIGAMPPARADDDFAGRDINLYVGSAPGGPPGRGC
jgi:hypothetical protein